MEDSTGSNEDHEQAEQNTRMFFRVYHLLKRNMPSSESCLAGHIIRAFFRNEPNLRREEAGVWSAPKLRQADEGWAGTPRECPYRVP